MAAPIEIIIKSATARSTESKKFQYFSFKFLNQPLSLLRVFFTIYNKIHILKNHRTPMNPFP